MRLIEHVKNHKEAYIWGSVGLAVGVGGAILFRNPTLISTTIKGDNNTVTNIVIAALGDPGNIVQCVETGTVYASQAQAAREMGLLASRISKHLNGKVADVGGYTFEVLGKAGTDLAK